jgi:hypothetical protein
MSVAVVCPSRERPQRCSAMIESMVNTSDAHALVYFDEDDSTHPPVGAWNGPRVRTLLGPRIGRGASINALCQTFRDYRCYLLVSDDIVFSRTGWDQEVEAAMDSFGDDIGLVHLSTGIDAGFCNWPCVSRKWVDAVGWFNPPTLRSYCQDTALQVMAEALGRIRYIEPPVLIHDCVTDDSGAHRFSNDLNAFLWFMALQFGPSLKKLRAVMS